MCRELRHTHCPWSTHILLSFPIWLNLWYGMLTNCLLKWPYIYLIAFYHIITCQTIQHSMSIQSADLSIFMHQCQCIFLYSCTQCMPATDVCSSKGEMVEMINTAKEQGDITYSAIFCQGPECHQTWKNFKMAMYAYFLANTPNYLRPNALMPL